MTLSTRLRTLIQSLAISLISAGSHLYMQASPYRTSIRTKITEYVPPEEAPEEAPEAAPSPDAVYVAWLDDIFANSPESDTRRG